ncbi:MAG: 5'/3'-nucleotidase SurE [Marinilabiliales bacterium]|nr:5'/3'-nucleotidase SurE [Marinilabiliales bacterium]
MMVCMLQGLKTADRCHERVWQGSGYFGYREPQRDVTGADGKAAAEGQAPRRGLTILRIYACSGTPTDGVKLAINQLLERKPDLIVSGINHGSNASASVLYSGTMAAALEGCLYGITSVGFSLNSYSPSADFSACEKYIRNNMQNGPQRVLLPEGVCLNVNMPAIAASEIKGYTCSKTGQGDAGRRNLKRGKTRWARHTTG